jgi:DNA-directed RNA polymerase
LVLAQIEHINPDLYHTLAEDFGRKRSRDVRHRMTVFKMQAAQAGIVIEEWSIGAREQVGLFIIEQLAALGMIVIDKPPMSGGRKLPGKRHDMPVMLAADVLKTINDITDIVQVTSPMYGPCVEPPQDWTSFSSGGFHTPRMRRAHPYLVKASSAARSLLRDTEMPIVLDAVNALQRTAWAINGRLLDIVLEVAKTHSVGEVVTAHSAGKPSPPAWLAQADSVKELPPAQQEEFVSWKHAMAEWYTQRKLAGVKYGRFYSATRAAATFRDYPAIHFVHFADSRGRLYPLTYGVNPQGSDLQKALLHFAVGKPLHTPEAVRWFHIQGANKFGFDKATLDDRVAWVQERQQLILAIGSDPINRTDWHEADNPLQFLAWCLEYCEWYIDPQGFESRIPVSMDGSCNGLQNFSAMLRDQVGGKATNLTDNAVMEDIYKRVAEAATLRMQRSNPDDLGFTARWLALGISRAVVKRAVMTTPYGVTKRSAIRYVIDDYLRKGAAPTFASAEYYGAAKVLMDAVWPAIGDVVVKSREAMDWLSSSAKVIANTKGEELEGVISWCTPSGFLATQSYYEVQEHRIRTRIHGTTLIKVISETDDIDTKRHSSGLAPNFVHSMDASHLHLTTVAARSRGIDALAMIHDDYGTHAADAELLYKLIRSEFVSMYEKHDPLEELHRAYPCCSVPPSKGTLDIREVLSSQYFFS